MRFFGENDLKENTRKVLEVINSGKDYETLSNVMEFKS